MFTLRFRSPRQMWRRHKRRQASKSLFYLMLGKGEDRKSNIMARKSYGNSLAPWER